MTSLASGRAALARSLRLHLVASLSCLALLLSACGDDDGDAGGGGDNGNAGQSLSQQLEGHWEIDSVEVRFEDGSEATITDANRDVSVGGGSAPARIDGDATFEAGGSYVTNFVLYVRDEAQLEPGDTGETRGSWTIEGENTLVLTDQADPTDFSIFQIAISGGRLTMDVLRDDPRSSAGEDGPTRIVASRGN